MGIVEEMGAEATRFKVEEQVGGTWIYSSCGHCRFCREGRENLCEGFQGTGCHADGGYAEYMIFPEDFLHKIPDSFTDLVKAAPLMCSEVIGYHSPNDFERSAHKQENNGLPRQTLPTPLVQP